MVSPIDADINETKHVTVEHWREGEERFPARIMRNFYFKHHNGDDNRENSVAEGFESGCGHLRDEIRINFRCLIC